MKHINATFWKIFANVLFSAMMAFIIANNSILRPPAIGSLYKEYIVGGIVMILFYSNIFFLYNRFYLGCKINQYLLLSLFFILAAVGLESLLVYPQIVTCYLSSYGKRYVLQYAVLYFVLIFFRDLGFFLASFGVCNILQQYHLTAIYEQHIREVKDEILVTNDSEKVNFSKEKPDMKSPEIRTADNQHLQTTGKKSIPSYSFTKIRDILYFEQFKNCTLLHTSEDNIFLRNSTLNKTMNIIGTDNILRVTKSVAIMKNYLLTYNDQHVILNNPIQNNTITLNWSPKYYYEALPVLNEWEKIKTLSESNTIVTTKRGNAKKTWVIPDLLHSNKNNQIYFYVSKHPGCKKSEISKKLKTPMATVSRILKQLKDEGLITYEGSKKTGGYSAVGR